MAAVPFVEDGRAAPSATVATGSAEVAATVPVATAAPTATASGQKVVLVSSDSQSFEVEKEVALCSGTIARLIADTSASDAGMPVPLPNVKGEIVQKIIDFCRHHIARPSASLAAEEGAEANQRTDNIDEWDRAFCNMEQATLFETILAANYLDIKPLLNVTCKAVANMIKGKTPDELRKVFNIENDLSEEEDEIAKDNQWIDDT
jgi:S-phase kinase-associated protein 1